MPILNDYNKLSESYQQTAVKPDKQFSTLPTVLKIAGNFENKVVLDLGCGNGFFSNEFAHNGAKKVFGVDNSIEQINLAKKNPLENTEYILADIFEDKLPVADIALAPYVVNYATDTKQLVKLFQNIFDSLTEKGKLRLKNLWGLNKKEMNGLLKKFRERYRNATRAGFLDSVADLDLIMLSLEQDGYLVTTDEGVLNWGRYFGVKEMPSQLFIKHIQGLT